MTTRAALSLELLLFAISSAALAASPEDFGHYVPAEKKLSRRWLDSLFERGERQAWRGEDLLTIGMPVGGIAAGQLYLRGDGTLAAWQIFNRHVFTGYGANCYRTYRPPSPVDSGFAVACRTADGLVVRRLCQEDFPQVEFAGEYPIGLVRYRQEGFPVAIELEAFSPFIPLDAPDSALPATIFEITVRNVSAAPLAASAIGWLENAVCIHSALAILANRRTRVVEKSGHTCLVHTAEPAPPPKGAETPRPTIVLADFEGPDYGDWKATSAAFGKAPAHGTLPRQQRVSGFLGKGLVNTYLGGDRPRGTLTSPPFVIERRFINFLVGGGNHPGRTCINLRVGGKVVRTATGRNNERLEWHFWDVADLEGETARIEIVDDASGAWGHINVDHIELADRPRRGRAMPLDQLLDFGSLVLALRGPSQPAAPLLAGAPWGKGISAQAEAVWPVAQRRSFALASAPGRLAPGQAHTFAFVLAWHFPNHPRGRRYATRFADAPAVADYILGNYSRLAGDTRLWHKTFYADSTLPRWLLFRLHSTVANLATGTCQWWKNGRFWAWEGVGCCAGTCTHVWNYSQAVARLFPSLERSAREMQDFGEGLDPATGLVGFRSNRAYAADGQCGTILKAYREHLTSPDNSFLRRNWPKIKKALLYSIRHDSNDDGLIEDAQHNTYDISFYGPNTFVGSLYLAALRAGEEMAREMGDEDFAARCHRIFESGRRLTIEKLWNGEYFIQRVDLKKHPKFQYATGCLSDQVFGQGWAHQLALGYIYPPELVKKALASIWKYNWAPDVGPHNKAHPPGRWFARPGEAGLFTCTWPRSPYLAQGVRYKNEVWTGIEYQVAGHMAWEGMVTEALAICRGIHERYHPRKHNPFNEVECGDHYARAMASWGAFTALCGFEYHGPRGHIGFAPRLTPGNFAAAFTAAEGWGLFSQKRRAATQTDRIEVRWGRLRLRSLAFALPQGMKRPGVAVRLDGKPIPATHSLEGARLLIRLREPIVVQRGHALEVRITSE